MSDGEHDEVMEGITEYLGPMPDRRKKIIKTSNFEDQKNNWRNTMNATRRKAISDLVNKLDNLKSIAEALRDEEQEFYDNMPESLQSGEKGDKAQEYASALEEAVDYLDQAISSLNAASE